MFHKYDLRLDKQLSDLIFHTSFHGRKREAVLQTHYKYYYRFIKDGSIEEFEQLIEYCIANNKSKSYCTSIIVTLVRLLKAKNPAYKKPFSEGFVSIRYRMINKIIENTKHNRPLYDNAGKLHHFDPTTLPSHVNMGVTTHINSNEAQAILDYVRTQLDEIFVMATTSNKSTAIAQQYPLEWELYLLIVLLAYTGRRVGEILSWTTDTLRDFVRNKHSEIFTKTGLSDVSIGETATSYLMRFLALPVKQQLNRAESKIFFYSYAKLRKANIRLYRKVLGTTKPNGLLFHVWRSYFANIATSINPTLTQNVLGHKSSAMTNRYITNQLMQDIDLKQELLTKVEKKLKISKFI